jgi:hypothetical protein
MADKPAMLPAVKNFLRDIADDLVGLLFIETLYNYPEAHLVHQNPVDCF